jgi:hypothetical protein
MHMGNHEPKAALVELRGAREDQKEREQRRLGSSVLGWPCSGVRAATREGERECHDERREREREGESRHIGLLKPRKASACGRARWRGGSALGDEQKVRASNAG